MILYKKDTTQNTALYTIRYNAIYNTIYNSIYNSIYKIIYDTIYDTFTFPTVIVLLHCIYLLTMLLPRSIYFHCIPPPAYESSRVGFFINVIPL